MYSAPASRAAVSKAMVRRISSLAFASSRSCSFGTLGRPKGCSRVRTTGIPPSGESLDVKWRAMENALNEYATCYISCYTRDPRNANWPH
eukprot:3091703-Pleurochrysis_carterae.AAC.1